MDFQLLPNLKWLRMSKKSSEYSFGRGQMTYDLQRAYMQEAMNLADAEVDFSGVQAVDVIANPAASAITFGPAFSGAPDFGGITADGVTLYNGTTSGVDMTGWGFLWLNHETGHTMGLVDLYSSVGTTDASIDQFTGDFSVMGDIGGKAIEPLAYERWLLGWLDDSQVICQESGDVTTTLTPIEVAGGTKAVMVPTGPTTGVLVEYRQPLGYDKKLPKAGALVYTIDTSVQSGSGPIKVLPVIAGDSFRDRSPLAAGESLTVGSVTIKVLAVTADGISVQVTVAQ
jgi:M6 family metalloprotease-like protein